MGNLPSLVDTAKPQHPNSPRDVKTRRCLPFPGQLSKCMNPESNAKNCEMISISFPPWFFKLWSLQVFKSHFFIRLGAEVVIGFWNTSNSSKIWRLFHHPQLVHHVFLDRILGYAKTCVFRLRLKSLVNHLGTRDLNSIFLVLQSYR